MIHEYKNSLLLRRHKIKLFYIFWKFLIYLLICLSIASVFLLLTWYSKQWNIFNQNIFIIFMFFFNFIAFALILDIIAHFNNLIYINDSHIYIIRSWLLFREDIEIIELRKVTKVSIVCQWLLSNMLSYWKIMIEMQRAETKPLFHIPEPYRVMTNIRNKMDKMKSIWVQTKELTWNKFDDTRIFWKI
ncbi:MAG: hypothetical protein ACD_3C00223G0030 [uncultured bacterium (gcode 4)]|uniref:DUF304 domain-containing protein n=1 Tax=uncultured bacterium (gcode 4) TaxID=1234023 RepID=K2FWH9_9BACT|nr:MAG: hypothetical protein ACD_3C00223G0030 [uncultured bacterium (gcode 4)]